MFRRVSSGPGEDDVIGTDQHSTSTPAPVIGHARAAIGSVVAVRGGGSAVQVNLGDPLYQGDIIETGTDGAVAITFNDGTTLDISSDARVALDEFVYDPNGSSNSILFHVARGTFALIAGRVADSGNLWIDTPVSRIRGTAQRGGMGAFTLTALTFAVIEELQADDLHLSAAPVDIRDFDPLTWNYFSCGTYEILTKDPIPKLLIVDDCGTSLVVRRSGSGFQLGERNK